MRLNLSVQFAAERERCPQRVQVRAWVKAAMEEDVERADITVRFVEEDEGRLLNQSFRHRDYATNVLSFTYAEGPDLAGDLVICLPVLQREAVEQSKSLEAHAAHLIVHGCLHLQGWDHETSDADAEAMEGRERQVLAALGYADPYAGA